MNIEDVAKNLNKKVKYTSITTRTESEYVLNACILRLGEDGFYYSAELKETDRNAVVIVPLEKVKSRS